MKTRTLKPTTDNLGCLNAWVEDGKTQQDRKNRLNECPEHLQAQVKSHAQLVFRMKNK